MSFPANSSLLCVVFLLKAEAVSAAEAPSQGARTTRWVFFHVEGLASGKGQPRPGFPQTQGPSPAAPPVTRGPTCKEGHPEKVGIFHLLRLFCPGPFSKTKTDNGLELWMYFL